MAKLNQVSTESRETYSVLKKLGAKLNPAILTQLLELLRDKLNTLKLTALNYSMARVIQG